MVGKPLRGTVLYAHCCTHQGTWAFTCSGFHQLVPSGWNVILPDPEGLCTFHETSTLNGMVDDAEGGGFTATRGMCAAAIADKLVFSVGRLPGAKNALCSGFWCVSLGKRRRVILEL